MSDAMTGFLTLWLIMAAPFIAWSIKIAEYRGRHVIFGIVLGLFFGGVGVALAWLLPPNEDVIWARRELWEQQHGIRRVTEPRAVLTPERAT